MLLPSPYPPEGAKRKQKDNDRDKFLKDIGIQSIRLRNEEIIN